ncbi:MAG: AAA family ATPase [Candidatus Erginobacter occultus]|nr:AAA family ATPase [Candidatus Erginobacter occultus]
MYEAYWKLKEKPFKNTADPRFLCSFPQHSDALMKLTYTVRENMGAAMLTGVFGCGKTFIARTLLASLSKNRYSFAYLDYPPVSGAEFLRAIVRTLKYSELPTKKTELLEDALLESLQALLLDDAREGKESVVVIDEAHSIEDERIFEKIRLLLNFQTESRFLLNLILVGQPELAGKVANIRQLEQRIAVKCHLEALTAEETKEYINRRLEVAGRSDPLFSDQVLVLIHQATGGIPRRINHICDACLMTGFARKKETIDEETFRESGKIFGSTIFPAQKL